MNWQTWQRCFQLLATAGVLIAVLANGLPLAGAVLVGDADPGDPGVPGGFEGSGLSIDSYGDCDAAALACTAALGIAINGCASLTVTVTTHFKGNVLWIFPVDGTADSTATVHICQSAALTLMLAGNNMIPAKGSFSSAVGNPLNVENTFGGWSYGNGNAAYYAEPVDYCVLPAGGHQICGPIGPSILLNFSMCVAAEAWVGMNGNGEAIATGPGPLVHPQGQSGAFIFARSSGCPSLSHPVPTVPPPFGAGLLPAPVPCPTCNSVPAGEADLQKVPWTSLSEEVQQKAREMLRDQMTQRVENLLADDPVVAQFPELGRAAINKVQAGAQSFDGDGLIMPV